MNPKIIKLASGEALYANRDLIKFIRSVIALPGEVIKPGDNIYFFKKVDFQRGLLDVSANKFQRVIKMEKANVVVVNSEMSFPENGVSFKDNKLDINLPVGEADDILFNISAYGADYVDIMKQWLEFFHLKNKPRVAFNKEIIEYVNSGIILNEETYQGVQDLMRNDLAIAAKMIDTCDIKSSFLYIMCILFFEQGYNQQNRSLFLRLSSVTQSYLINRGCGNVIPSSVFNEMLGVDFIREKMTATLVHKINETIKPIIAGTPLIETYNVDIAWKKPTQ